MPLALGHGGGPAPAVGDPLEGRGSGERAVERVGPLPFEQQPRESVKAFAAFSLYLSLGPQRSTAAVASKLAKSEQLIRRWSAKYDWLDRVKAHVAYLAVVEREAIERLATEKAVEWWKLHEPVRREAWLEAERAIAMVRMARERWEKSQRTPGFEGMARMLELAFKLKQFAAGMPSEIKETHTLVTGKVSVEWEAAIRKAYGVVEPVVEVEDVKSGGQLSVNSNQLSVGGEQKEERGPEVKP